MSINVLILINGSTLITILVLGIRLMKFIDRIEFRTDLMWEDYKRRTDHILTGRRRFPSEH